MGQGRSNKRDEAESSGGGAAKNEEGRVRRSLSWENGLRRESTEFIRLRKESLFCNKELLADLKVPPGVRGLDNLGNTCFMNAALQCLSNTAPLSDYLIGSKLWQSELNKANPLGSGGKVAVTYASLLEALWSEKSSGKSIAPRKFKSTLSEFAPSFKGYRQHDCQELLCALLDGLHEDLNRVTKKPSTQVPDADGRQDEIVAAEHWAIHLMRNKSIIVDILQGQLKSTVTCKACGFTSVTFDPFMYLSLPFPENAGQGEAKDVSVESLLEEFLREETLDGDEKWFCPKCKEFHSAVKKLDLYKLPPILIIHLKRFKSIRYRTTKISTHVTFPMEDFDLARFAVGERRNLPGYDLYAVARHIGGYGGGHYNANCKNRVSKEWYCFDDAHCRPIAPKEVIDSNAYVLFYQNRLTTHMGYRKQSFSRPNLWPHALPADDMAAIMEGMQRRASKASK